MIDWFVKNKEWFFSGAGIAIIATIATLIRWWIRSKKYYYSINESNKFILSEENQTPLQTNSILLYPYQLVITHKTNNSYSQIASMDVKLFTNIQKVFPNLFIHNDFGVQQEVGSIFVSVEAYPEKKKDEWTFLLDSIFIKVDVFDISKKRLISFAVEKVKSWEWTNVTNSAIKRLMGSIYIWKNSLQL